MGKKGKWFSAITRVFTNNSKDKPIDGSSDRKSSREKKKGRGILRNGENRSFIPLFREPSSIEKIFGEADQLLLRPPPITTIHSEQQLVRTALIEKPNSPRITSPPKPASLGDSLPNHVPSSSSVVHISSPKTATGPSRTASASSKAVPQKALTSSGAETSSRAAPEANITKVVEREKDKEKINRHIHNRPEPTLRYQHLSACKIQAAFRGYQARRSFRALRGLVRLQGFVRGQNVKRQTANAMKQMQLLVRVQTQIQSRRIQMFENQALLKNKKEVESTLSKWTNQLSEMNNENWNDSVVTKEEADTRLRKKVEAVIKRERAMAYAYSHQPGRANPNSVQAYQDVRSNGFPWWWNFLERQFLQTTSNSQNQTNPFSIFSLTPPRAVSEYNNKRPTHSNNYNNKPINFPTPGNQESLTPRSSRSQALSIRGKQFHTPSRTPPPQPFKYSSASPIKYSKQSVKELNSSYNDVTLRDDDSLLSCPPFSAPSYMMPTVSAKAKVRSNSNPKERFMGTPGDESTKKRFSFPLTPKWNSSSKRSDSGSNQRALEKRDSSRSIGDLSIDSTVSMPAIVGRKPFNRFV